MQILNNLSICIVFVCVFFKTHLSISVDKDLTLSWEQKRNLDKFKIQVSPYLPHEYMKKEPYLITWLRARDFNLRAAEAMLLENLEWRKRNKIDESHEEDWTAFGKRYKYWKHARDREGQPVAYLELGSWNILQAVIAGERNKLLRYLDMVMDQLCKDIRDFQDKGQNLTRVDLVVDLNGFSIAEQGCLQCLPVYIQFVLSYESHFPSLADKILLLNTPAAFEIVLNAIRPFLSRDTRESMEVYGMNRRQYQSILNKYIAPEELPPEVGGSDFINYEIDLNK